MVPFHCLIKHSARVQLTWALIHPIGSTRRALIRTRSAMAQVRKRGVGARSRGTLRTAPSMDPTTSARTRATIGACQASLGLIREGAVISLGLIVSFVALIHTEILFILREYGADSLLMLLLAWYNLVSALLPPHSVVYCGENDSRRKK